MLKQLQVAVKEARDREGVLTAITTMNRALEEVDWLAEYEDDPNKYKVDYLHTILLQVEPKLRCLKWQLLLFGNC